MVAKLTPRGGNGVEIQLRSMVTNDQVYWSPQRWRIERGRREPAGGGNSYVITPYTGYGNHLQNGFHLPDEGATPVNLFSINGAGEIRWPVDRYRIDRAVEKEREGTLSADSDDHEFLLAARHFGLVEAERAKVLVEIVGLEWEALEGMIEKAISETGDYTMRGSDERKLWAEPLLSLAKKLGMKNHVKSIEELLAENEASY